MKRDEYFIIGNSTAAIGAIEGIRRVDSDTPIGLASREPYHTYSRPLISRLLAGEAGDDDMYFRADNFYRHNGVNARLNVSIVLIDPAERAVYTETGEKIGFSKLLIATGGAPVIPRIEGISAEGVFTFVSWDDARAVDEYIRAAVSAEALPRAVVIGAGMIGIKAIEALRARSVEVSIVEREDRIMPLALNREAALILEQAVKRAGADVRCGVEAQKVVKDGSGRVAGVVLSNGREIPCEMIILAVGVSPETELTRGTDIMTDTGILIDERCMTSVDGIYAAGDVAQGIDALSGDSRPMPLFPNAFRQGRVAGTNMAGGQAATGDMFAMNSMEVFGVPMVSVGQANITGNGLDVLEKFDLEAGNYKRIVLKENRVVGALAVGDIERIGIFTGLIRAKADVSDVRDILLTDGFGLLSLPLEYRKHIVRGEGIEV